MASPSWPIEAILLASSRVKEALVAITPIVVLVKPAGAALLDVIDIQFRNPSPSLAPADNASRFWIIYVPKSVYSNKRPYLHSAAYIDAAAAYSRAHC